MSFHPRKLFHQYLSSNDTTMEWRPIYSPTPSPLLSPISVSLPWLPPLVDEDHMHQYYVLIIIIVMGSTCGIVLLLITMNKILRYCNSRRYYVSRTNPPILFDIRGDSPFSDDEEPTMRHPTSLFIPSEGLQQSIIDSITVFKYRKDEGLIQGTECLICLSEYQQEESLKLLPKCSHAFHVPCIDTWFGSHKNCPLCRAPIVHDVGGDTEMVRTTESDSSFSNMNEDIEESESSVVDEDSSEDGGRGSVTHDKVLCHSPISIGSACLVSGNEFEEEIEHMRRCVSVDSSLDIESSDTNLVVENNVSFSSNNDVMAKHGGENSTIYKVASIDQDRHFSLRRSSSSHNRKFIFCRRSWSQSSTLPL